MPFGVFEVLVAYLTNFAATGEHVSQSRLAEIMGIKIATVHYRAHSAVRLGFIEPFPPWPKKQPWFQLTAHGEEMLRSVLDGDTPLYLTRASSVSKLTPRLSQQLSFKVETNLRSYAAVLDALRDRGLSGSDIKAPAA